MNKTVLALSITMIMAAIPLAAAISVDTPVVTSNWIVGFRGELPQEVRDGHYGADRVVGINDAINFAVIETVNPVGLQARAAFDPNVQYIEEDLEVAHTMLTPNDTYFAQYQYDVKATTTNIVAAWDRSTGSSAVKVAIADTGVRSTAADLVGQTIAAQFDFVSNDGTAQDGNGHGSHVASTIAARINNAKGLAGIAPGSSMVYARVLNNQGSGTCSQVANGITFAGDQGSHILSMSLGGGGCSGMQTATAYTQGKGTLVIAAAGNGGCTNCVEFPAKYAGVVAVSATDQNNALASFSSTGPEVFIAAPGVSTVGHYPAKSACGGQNLDTCYALLSGTSMSTPHVAAVAALIKATHSTYDAAALKTALQTSALDLGAAGRDNNFGYGLLQGSAV